MAATLSGNKKKGGALANAALPSLRYTPLFPLGFVQFRHCVVQVFVRLNDAVELGLLLRREQRTNLCDRSIDHCLGLLDQRIMPAVMTGHSLIAAMVGNAAG